MQQVPRGTNGGVSLLGLFAAAAGGAFIGLTFFIVGYFTASCTGRTGSAQWLLLPIGTAVGLLGSLFDSVLGATVQFSGNCAVRKKVRCSLWCIEHASFLSANVGSTL